METVLIPTSVGELTVLVVDGVVVASGFVPATQLLQRRPNTEVSPAFQPAGVNAVRTAFTRYIDGELDALNSVIVDQSGTPFQHRVWAALRRIPAAERRTYSEIAAEIGHPSAARAVGTACAANMAAVVVPCHRVVPAEGGVGNYAYGFEAKTWLLNHETRP